MEEYILSTSREIYGLYPHVHVWGFPISAYLFLGGLAAGILLFATIYYLNGKEDDMPFTVKIAPIFTFGLVMVGLVLLLYDLHHVLYSWQLFTTFRIESPMSWGAWTLIVVSIFSLLWPLSYIDDIEAYLHERGWKRLDGITKFIRNVEHKWLLPRFIILTFRKYRKVAAYLMLFSSIILGIYTGILLSAFNAHPLWNNSILGPLFLVSGISTGSAFVMWLSNNHKERALMSKIDIALIAVELFFIIHMIMGMQAGTEAYRQAAHLFLGGEYTVIFWVVFVGFGLVLPFILEALELKGFKVHPALPALLVLLGGLLFRIIMVNAGQISEFPI
ncbi:MAG TPA: nitrite reductase [Lutibacter sp.]|nr:nitrite reductase [Lutibacter sp.]